MGGEGGGVRGACYSQLTEKNDISLIKIKTNT